MENQPEKSTSERVGQENRGKTNDVNEQHPNRGEHTKMRSLEFHENATRKGIDEGKIGWAGERFGQTKRKVAQNNLARRRE